MQELGSWGAFCSEMQLLARYYWELATAYWRVTFVSMDLNHPLFLDLSIDRHDERVATSGFNCAMKK